MKKWREEMGTRNDIIKIARIKTCHDFLPPSKKGIAKCNPKKGLHTRSQSHNIHPVAHIRVTTLYVQ